MDYVRDHTPLASQQEGTGRARSKTFNDNVHGHITLHRASVALVDTKEFQRLRHLKQLGLTYYIYPGASHNRFEHSLGVAHLASEWGKHLIGSGGSVGEDGWQLCNFEPEDRKHLTILQLAGLCHDLGHGPFSHVFEKELLPKLYPSQQETVVKEWHHENMSNKIFDHITCDASNGLDLQELAGLTECDLGLIKKLMHGSDNPAFAHPSAPWLYDVVANKRNGIDVDKFDYLLRDSKMCGVTVPLDHKRLMLLSKLDRSREQVTFKFTEYNNLSLGLFQSRAEMHRRVYTHQKVKSIEFMVCDALALAQEPLGLKEAVTDLEQYLKLDDSLLLRVQWLDPEAAHNPRDILKAQELLESLARRQLYKFVREVTVDARGRAQLLKHCQGGLPTPAQVVGYQSSAIYGVDLVDYLDDIILCETHIDSGMKEANPMDAVRFYQTTDAVMGDRSFSMPQQQVSSMLGTVYQDKKIRVYCKRPDKNVQDALKHAFEQWSKQVLNCEPPGTPWKQKQQQRPDIPPGSRPLSNGSHGMQQHPPSSVLRGFNADAPPVAGGAGFTECGSNRGAAAGATRLFPDAPGDTAATAASGGLEEQQLESQCSQQQQQHMGSSGRSRKRSLSQEMSAASQQQQQQQQLGSQRSSSQQQQQQQLVAAVVGGSSPGSEPVTKHSRANGSCDVGSGSGGPCHDAGKAAAAAVVAVARVPGGCGSKRLPGIAEEAVDEAGDADLQVMQQ